MRRTGPDAHVGRKDALKFILGQNSSKLYERWGCLPAFAIKRWSGAVEDDLFIDCLGNGGVASQPPGVEGRPADMQQIAIDCINETADASVKWTFESFDGVDRHSKKFKATYKLTHPNGDEKKGCSLFAEADPYPDMSALLSMVGSFLLLRNGTSRDAYHRSRLVQGALDGPADATAPSWDVGKAGTIHAYTRSNEILALESRKAVKA